MVREMYLTNSVVRRLIGLQPILVGVPELKAAMTSMPEFTETKRKPCRKCRKKSGAVPTSSAKVLAPVIAGLSDDKKQLILRTLNTGVLKGFLADGPRLQAVVIAERPA